MFKNQNQNIFKILHREHHHAVCCTYKQHPQLLAEQYREVKLLAILSQPCCYRFRAFEELQMRKSI